MVVEETEALHLTVAPPSRLKIVQRARDTESTILFIYLLFRTPLKNKSKQLAR